MNNFGPGLQLKPIPATMGKPKAPSPSQPTYLRRCYPHHQAWVGLQLKPKPITKSKPKSSKLPHNPPLQPPPGHHPRLRPRPRLLQLLLQGRHRLLLKTWFKVAVSVTDSEGLEAYRSRCIGLVSGDT